MTCRVRPDRALAMVESEDLAQLRQLNLKLMQQLWVGQEAVRQSVAKAASEVSTHCGNSPGVRKVLPSPQASRPILGSVPSLL